MMRKCMEGHEEIWFIGRRCPFCESLADLGGTIDNLEKQLLVVNEAFEEVVAEKVGDV